MPQLTRNSILYFPCKHVHAGLYATLHWTGTQWYDDLPVLLLGNPDCPVKHGTTVCINWHGCIEEPVHLQRMLCVMPAGMLPVQASAEMLQLVLH